MLLSNFAATDSVASPCSYKGMGADGQYNAARIIERRTTDELGLGVLERDVPESVSCRHPPGPQPLRCSTREPRGNVSKKR